MRSGRAAPVLEGATAASGATLPKAALRPLRFATAVAISAVPAVWMKRGSVGSRAKLGLLKIAPNRGSSRLAYTAKREILGLDFPH
jgi:hypothetical protein